MQTQLIPEAGTVVCQHHIPTVWMPPTCTVCKHNQVGSESLKVLTFWSNPEKVYWRVLYIDLVR